jgi:hypothetical protein
MNGTSAISSAPSARGDTLRVQFVPREHGPQRLLSEAEVHFEDGPLAGTRLLGFSLWRNPLGEIYVTFPSRTTGAAGERRYFDFLRSADGRSEAVRRVKAWILDEYRKHMAAGT